MKFEPLICLARQAKLRNMKMECDPQWVLDLAAERDQLRAEAERLRMQLAACGVVALANTPESAAKARDMHPDYMSASCQDVMRAVDREMALRAEVEALRKDAERYRWLRKGESDDVAVVRGLGAMDYGMSAVVYTYSKEIGGDDLDAAIDAAMAAKEGV